MKNKDKEKEIILEINKNINEINNPKEFGLINMRLSDSRESEGNLKNVTSKKSKEISDQNNKEELNIVNNSFEIHTESEKKNICCNELNKKCNIF